MRFSRTNQETLRRNFLSTSTNAYQNSNQTSFNFIHTGKPTNPGGFITLAVRPLELSSFVTIIHVLTVSWRYLLV